MKQLLLIIFVYVSLFSQEVPLSKVNISGTRKTKKETVLAIIKLDSTATTCIPDTIEQRLKNRELFAKIDVQYNPADSTLNIVLKDSWSISPVISGRKSAGVFNYKLGLYENNFLGRDITIGGQYDNYASSHNVQMLFQKRNIGSRRLTVGTTFLTSTRNYLWRDDLGTKEAGFSVDKTIVILLGQLPLIIKEKEFKLGLTCSFMNQKSTDKKSSDSTQLLNQEMGYNFEDTLKAILTTGSLQYSTINISRFIADGWASKISLTRTFAHNKIDYFKAAIFGQFYKKLPFRSNLCINGELRGLNSDRPTALYYVGHSNGIRGFYNSEFRGKAMAQLNTELRIQQLSVTFFKKYEFIAQPAIFCDLLSIGDRVSSFFDTNRTYVSTGAGLRVVSPSFSSFMLNLDFAWGFGEKYNRYNYYIGTSYYFKPIK